MLHTESSDLLTCSYFLYLAKISLCSIPFSANETIGLRCTRANPFTFKVGF